MISVLDFISPTEHAAIAARTSTTDVASQFQDAVDYINSLGGGCLYVPSGTYSLSIEIDLCRNLTVTGEGRTASILKFNHAGTGFKSESTINSSTGVNIHLEKIQLHNTNSSNTGGGFYDQAGTFIGIVDCCIRGFKYSVILDQSELVDLDLCQFEVPLAAAVWLVNGPDLNPSSNPLFTNRISIKRCQFNGSSGIAIQDDGGYCHSFVDNNYNGFTNHLRLAGVEMGIVQGGEFEAATGDNIVITHLRVSGGGAGAPTLLIMGTIIAPTANQSPISIVSAIIVSVIGNLFANTVSASVPSIEGVGNASRFFARGNRVESVGPFTDAYATIHDDGYLPIRAESGTSVTGALAHQNSLVRFTSGSAVTYTVPPNSSVAYVVGTVIEIEQGGAGAVTVSPGSGVTINSRGSLLRSNGQYARMKLEKTATDRWVLSGDRA